MENTISFNNNLNAYKTLAERRILAGDYRSALGFLFSALKENEGDIELLATIADVYGQMDLLELSNQYWFYYLAKAPADKKTVAYEELAMNYFSMEDFWTSGYYFNLKMSIDGRLSQVGLEKELAEYLEQSLGDERCNIHVAYPYDKADYSKRLKAAKRAMNAGDYKACIELYDAIPYECMDEDTMGEYAFSCFLQKKDEQVKEICKKSIERFGKNVTAYCNLSTLYKAKGDIEKSTYYYEQAKSISNGGETEPYKLATCAIDHSDNIEVEKNVALILKERQHDHAMWFFYGIALLNIGKHEQGANAISTAYKIAPTDTVYKFYAEYAQALARTGNDSAGLLPLKYEIALPDKIKRRYRKIIREFSKEEFVAKKAPKREELYAAFEWGIMNGDTQTIKQSTLALAFSGSRAVEKRLFDMLMRVDVSEKIKKLIIFALIVSGYKGKINVVAGRFFVSVKQKKLVFEKDPLFCDLYLSAYALALSRAVFWHVGDLDKLAFATNKVYKKTASLAFEALSCEDIAALTVYACEFKELSNFKEICSMFDADFNRLRELATIVRQKM